MDTEKTAPFELGEGADACLLLHGFTGSPWDLRLLGESLAARGMRVVAPRLAGHGTTPEALAAVDGWAWQRGAEQALADLGSARRVFVAGLSMGALLGVQLAARFPHRVHALGLIAPALRFRGPKMTLLRALRKTRALERALPWIAKDSTDLEDDATRAEAPILRAIPSARLNDLFRLQDRAAQELGHVRCATFIAVATHDHVVDPHGGRVMASRLTRASTVRLLEIDRGFHIIPRDRAAGLLAEELGTFFERAAGRRMA